MERLIIALALAALVGTVAGVLQSRRRSPSPAVAEPGGYPIPRQIDRLDFDRPDAPWLVVVFTSATCLSCSGTWEKARLLESPSVAAQEVEVGARRDLHDRYGVEAVPVVVVADADGAVRASFVGPPTATDLWATLAELRQPGSTPAGCDRHGSAPAS